MTDNKPDEGTHFVVESIVLTRRIGYIPDFNV